jgi:hypothetical protein
MYHFYFRSEDGSTSIGVLITASVDKSWYYTATDAYSTKVVGKKKGEGKKGNKKEWKTQKSNVVAVL